MRLSACFPLEGFVAGRASRYCFGMSTEEGMMASL